MRINQLRQIVTVSEIKSINAAAKQLFLSQSSLSASISAMEKELDRELLIRSHDGISLSEFGHHFVEAAREILNIYDNVIHLPSIHRESRLYISSQFLLYVSSIFTNLHSQYEKTVSNFRFAEKTTSGVIHDLINRTSEVGIIVTRSDHKQFYMDIAEKYGLDYHMISTDESRCLVGEGNPLYSYDGDSITQDQLRPFPAVQFEQEVSFVEKDLEMKGTFFPHTGKLVISDTGSLQNILARTNGYFVGIHNIKAYKAIDFYRHIRVLKVRDNDFSYDTAWLHKKGQPLSFLAKEFLQRVYSVVGNSNDSILRDL